MDANLANVLCVFLVMISVPVHNGLRSTLNLFASICKCLFSKEGRKRSHYFGHVICMYDVCIDDFE